MNFQVLLSFLCYIFVYIISRDCQNIRYCYKNTIQLLEPEGPLVDTQTLDLNCDGDIDQLAITINEEKIEDFDNIMSFGHAVESLNQKIAGLGTDNIDSVEYYYRLGMIFLKMSDYHSALKYFDSCQTIRETKLGFWHLDTSFAFDYQGSILEKTGKFQHAFERYEKSLQIKRYILGNNHLGVANAYKNIGRIFFSSKKFKDALTNFQQALAIYGEDHHCSASIYNRMGIIYQETADLVNAFKCYEKSMEIRKASLGSINNNREMGPSYFNLAQLYKIKQEDKFMTYYEKYFDAKASDLQEGERETIVLYNHMAAHYHEQGDFQKALHYYQKLAEFINTDSYHPQSGIIYNNLALLYHEIGNRDLTLEYSEKALKANLFNHGENSLYTSASNFLIGVVNEQNSNYEEALKYYWKAINIIHSTNGSDELCNALIYNRIANVYAKQGEFSAAHLNWNKALKRSVSNKTPPNECSAVQLIEMAEAYIKESKYIDAYLILIEASHFVFPTDNLQEQEMIKNQTAKLLEIVSSKINLLS